MVALGLVHQLALGVDVKLGPGLDDELAQGRVALALVAEAVEGDAALGPELGRLV
jgi:hypothetical protein